MIGVYSANPSGPLSLLERTRRLDPTDIALLERDRAAVRIPAMRLSVFVVPGSNASAVFSATRRAGSASPYPWLLRASGIDKVTHGRLRRSVLRAARVPLGIRDIRAGIPDSPRELGVVLQAMCAEGVLLWVGAGGVRSNTLSYVATEAWLGSSLGAGDREAALADLAGGYLRAFGPAGVEDFAWWAGIRVPEARRALGAHRAIDVGDGLLLHESDVARFRRTPRVRGRVNLLPKWDCYTMGYPADGRARFVQPELTSRVYDRGGDALPVVLVDGEVRGRWEHRFERDRDRLRIEVDTFERPAPDVWAAVEQRARAGGALLGAAALAVERSSLASD